MLMMKLKDMRMGTFKGMTALDKKAPGRRGKFFRNVSGNAVEWLGEEVATPFFGVKKNRWRRAKWHFCDWEMSAKQ